MRWILALATSFVLTATLSGCGASPSATLVLPAQVAEGEKVEAEGVYTEAKPGLEVVIKERGSDEALATTTTSKDGRFKATLTPEGVGESSYVASVRDGDKTIASKVRKLLVLGKTAAVARLKGDAEATIGAKRMLVGKVEPAEAGRAVTLETSADAEAWTTTETMAKTDADGSFELPVSTEKVGEVYLRAAVEPSKTHAKAQSIEEFFGVYDYKAAGKHYLGCVKELNEKLKEYQNITGFETYKGSAGRMAERSTRQAQCLRDYAWPPSVAEEAEEMAQNADVDADVWNQMSGATDFEEYDELAYSLSDDSIPATRIRARLGLPRRSAD